MELVLLEVWHSSVSECQHAVRLVKFVFFSVEPLFKQTLTMDDRSHDVTDAVDHLERQVLLKVVVSTLEGVVDILDRGFCSFASLVQSV